MKKFSSGLLLSFMAIMFSAFVIYAADPSVSITSLSPAIICANGNDTLIYSVSASNIPANTNVVIYQSTDSTFNPSLGQGDSIGFLKGDTTSTSVITSACPKILGIFIDACNDSGRLEPANEYMVITSGQGFLASNLKIDLPNTNLRDINIGSNPCIFGTPSNTLMTLLRTGFCNSTNLIAASQADSIPPNALVIVFTGAGTDYPYNLSRFCQTGQKVYVLQNACTNGSGAFVNNDAAGTTCNGAAAATRYRTTTLSNRNCFDELTYDRCGLNEFDGANPNANDGNYVIRLQSTDTSSVANGGIQNNAADRCNGIVLDSIIKTKTLKYAIPTAFCNTGIHYIKAILKPAAIPAVLSNTIQFKYVCNDVRATSTTQNICSGDSAIINISSTDQNATFSWTTSGGNGIAGQSSGTGNSIKQLLTYAGNTKDSVTYNITSNDNGCTKTTSVKVVVNKCLVCTPDFSAPDTVCVGENINLTNLSANCATTNYWNFCSGNLNFSPNATNVGNSSNNLNSPAGIALAFDGINYYSFITNHFTRELIRNNYGNSYLNTPTSTNLGTFSNVIQKYVERIQIIKDNGNFYGFVVGGHDTEDSARIVRLDFGANLGNIPTAINLGNIGLLSFPTDIYMFKDNSNIWHGLITNFSSGPPAPGDNTITRVDFNSGIQNLPVGTNLGGFGLLNRPVGLHIIQENNNNYLFVVNRNNNKLVRINFGNSLVNNSPTATDLGNPGNLLSFPRDITILKDCGSTYGYITNEGTNKITKLNFSNSVIGTIQAQDLGNIGGLNFPDAISDVFRVRDNVYVFINNVTGNTQTRLSFSNCTNSSIPSSTQANPPVFSYDTTGSFNVSLTIDEGLLTQSTVCKSIIVKKCDTCNVVPVISGNTKVCNSVPNILSVAGQYDSVRWNTGANTNSINVTQAGNYAVTVYLGVCSGTANTDVTAANVSVRISGDDIICGGTAGTLTASGQFDSLRWNTGASTAVITVTQEGAYSVTAYSNGCSATSAFNVGRISIYYSLDKKTDTICPGDTAKFVLSAGDLGIAPVDTFYYTQPGKYIISYQTPTCGIFTDSVTVIEKTIPKPTITGNLTICSGASTTLDAGSNYDSYVWQPNGEITQAISVNTPATYSVTVKTGNCSSNNSVTVSVTNPPAVFSLGNDTSFCGNFTKVLSTGNPSTFWSTDFTGSQITVTQGGQFIATISNACGAVSDTIILTQNSLPLVFIGNDTAFCEGELTLSINEEQDIKSVLWNTGAQTGSITVSTIGVYSVKVTNSKGCSDSDAINISSNCTNEIWLPNAFTPDGNGVNDVFYVRGNPRNVTIEKFVIYNRWGNKVFESYNTLPDDITAGWNGYFKNKIEQLEVYGYEVRAVFANGEKRTLKGNVTLLK